MESTTYALVVLYFVSWARPVKKVVIAAELSTAGGTVSIIGITISNRVKNVVIYPPLILQKQDIMMQRGPACKVDGCRCRRVPPNGIRTAAAHGCDKETCIRLPAEGVGIRIVAYREARRLLCDAVDRSGSKIDTGTGEIA